jgi:hypothetical protein
MGTSNRSETCCAADRRRFLKASVATFAAASIPRFAHAAPSSSSGAETVVAEFYQSLTDAQRKEICRPFGDELRSRVNANWHVSKPLISDDFYSDSQRGMIEKIVRGLTSADGFKRLEEQMEYDDGGLGAYSVAMFGEPSAEQFQWLLTGRHLTLRADGNTLEGRAFGGPIVYGHGEESSASDNLFYYQTKRVNEVFAALDSSQAATALRDQAPAETQVALQGASGKFDGIQVGSLAADQQKLVRDVLGTLLAPYREEDASEALSIIDKNGGIESLRFAFYKNGDLESDGVWDIWRIEGPSTVIHFRGAPHVHAYLHIGEPA